MRVVVIGGAARSLVNFRGPLLESMVARGHQVVACAPDAPENVRSELADIGVSYRHIGLKRAAISPVADLRALREVMRLFRQVRPGVVLSYTVKPVIWGSIGARLTGIPRIFAMVTGMGQPFDQEAKASHKIIAQTVSMLYGVALHGAEAVFFQNPDDEREFRARGILRADTHTVSINGSGVDLERFAQESQPRSPVFLLMARLIGGKGIREYRDAARLIRKRYPEARFFLAGAKDLNPTAIADEELARWQTEGDIEYLGHLEDVRPALARCAVYVLPSYYREGTPRTLLEAMATGRPIITTDAPGCRETVVEGVNGHLVPPRDSHALAEAMERLIGNPGEIARMGWESRRIAEEKYDVHEVNRVVLETMGL